MNALRATVGIEAVNAYVGRASFGVRELFAARDLDDRRMDNLMMERKSVNLPCEDPVTNAVNAAKPLVDALSAEERDRIELVVVGTESGLDFGKPISTYVQDLLGLGKRCRSFEVKHACYGGTAALQTAAAVVATSPMPGAKALVVAADASSVAARDTYWEPSQGAGAVAMLVGDDPQVLALDPGANGYHSFEVMDTLRPRPDLEAGDSDLSLMAYMECLVHSFRAYRERVPGADLMTSFDHLVFHTPFAGMVKGAHRRLRRAESPAPPAEIDADFTTRVEPCLRYASQVGNVYSAALYLALCSLVDHVDLSVPKRLGMFSYGSGCASEFYSGVVTPVGRARVAGRRIADAIADRRPLSLPEYELISDLGLQRMAGVRDHAYDVTPYADVYEDRFAGRGLLVLDKVVDFHRRYRWS
ncbi:MULTISPECIES: hydroxymethylglutaryl-CoA synthase family protein [Streptomyces]|uniref:Hydroxymethylglutaryl-CoA synthase n=1 Tax=Streptomyces sp. JL1001 TaxID=3078227 RepID=A0AAU8KB04_9ACTN|nr:MULTISPECIES: hydroxymethylglutaryl-CoA synthase [unclassified Streptomyces]PJN27247.1 3-hydroxy-3-methylglutaryl-ACP synthase [Streptomyces sp. CB02613]SCE60112.1 hydroxymethylglutaryl-CoA synthase [Streptomyces sp. Termitarium-T10T-6]